jgi:hypothetical protein
MQGLRGNSILCQTRAKSESLPSSFSPIQNISKKRCILLESYKSCKQLSALSNTINYQKGSLSSLSYLRDDCRKQAILISESGGDSNRCTPYKGKLDQHNTYASHASPRTPGVCFLWVVPVRGNLSQVIDRVEQGHCSREKGLLKQSIAHRLTDPRVCTQFLSRANLEAVGAKPSCRWQATRLTGPISPAYDRYIQYLLAGVNPSILDQHRWGLQS